MRTYGWPATAPPPWELDFRALWRAKIDGSFQKSRRRGLPEYDKLLFQLRRVAPWQPESLIAAVGQQVVAHPGETIRIADFGCGHGVALLGLANWTTALGLPCAYLGVDKGDSAPIRERPDAGGDAGHTRLRPMPFDRFPDTPERLGVVMAHFFSEITAFGGPQPGPLPVRFERRNLDDADWDLAPESVHLALSSTAMMYVQEKLAFLEKVYAGLCHGGVAMLHFDELMPPFLHKPTLRRLVLPGDMDFGVMLQQHRYAGVPIHSILHGNKVFVLMRKDAARPLDFGFELVESAVEGLRGPEQKPWGSHSRYAVRGEAAGAPQWPDLAARIDPPLYPAPPWVDRQAPHGELRRWLAAHRRG